MNLFKNIPGADNTEAIEKLIGTGDYGKAQGDVEVLIEQIRAQEALFEEAQEAFSIYTRNLQHVKSEGIIADDSSAEILALLEEGAYAKAKESAEMGILSLATTTHDWYAARENGAIYLHTLDRLLSKGVVVPDDRHTFAEPRSSEHSRKAWSLTLRRLRLRNSLERESMRRHKRVQKKWLRRS